MQLKGGDVTQRQLLPSDGDAAERCKCSLKMVCNLEMMMQCRDLHSLEMVVQLRGGAAWRQRYSFRNCNVAQKYYCCAEMASEK